MKAFIVFVVLVTLSTLFFRYKKEKNTKKLIVSIFTFVLIVSLAIAGTVMKSVVPLFIAHEILLVIAWGALFVYIFTGKYCWWWYIAPLLSILLFLVLEFLGGSAHESV